jgi:hypothetical protein
MSERMPSFCTRFHWENFRSRFFGIFSWTLAATAVAKGSALLHGYSMDDYPGVLRYQPSLESLLFEKGSRGRFGSALLTSGLQQIDLNPAYSVMIFVVCSILVSALFATLVVRFWNLDRKGWLAPAMACIIANHPYTAELFTFRLALGVAIFPVGMLCLMLIPRRWSAGLLATGSVVFAVLLSIYQLALHSGLMIVLVGAAIWLARYQALGNRLGWTPRVLALLSPRQLLRHRNTALLGSIALGTVLYVAMMIALATSLRVDLAPRTQLVHLSQWGTRASAVFTELQSRLFEPNPLITSGTQWMLLLLLTAAVAGQVARTRGWSRRLPPLLTPSILLLLGAALLWSFGVLLVTEEFWPTSRVLAHTGIFWAGVLAIARLGLNRSLRGALGGLAVVIVLSFVGANNRILGDQLRLNLRDAHKVNRVIGRLESMPGFPAVRVVAIVGGSWTYPLRLSSADHDLNISAFAADWARVELLAEVSGYDLRPAIEEAQIAAAAAYCRAREPWPGPEATAIVENLAIVCLEAPP